MKTRRIGSRGTAPSRAEKLRDQPIRDQLDGSQPVGSKYVVKHGTLDPRRGVRTQPLQALAGRARHGKRSQDMVREGGSRLREPARALGFQQLLPDPGDLLD
jgi:hypothetical protein